MPGRSASKPPAKAAARSKVLLVVRRGAKRRRSDLKRHAKRLPVAVVWDRRAAERRGEPERGRETDRRIAERRQPAPFTWKAADFLVVVPARPRHR